MLDLLKQADQATPPMTREVPILSPLKYVVPSKDFAEEVPKDDFIIRSAKWILTILRFRQRQLEARDPEYRLRREEAESKLLSPETLRGILGERVDTMWYVDRLATDPASQGHGYGSALLNFAVEMADKSNNAIWLASSNAANNGFYNYHGFETVGTAYMGTENPNWEEKPVAVCFVSRLLPLEEY
ncbi:hypothetical protein H0H92_004025 [Tricholoma furcatifolium]|nr:hypothetical protein H0H92_004025 [Tricholoma furcatifolium]